MSAPNLLVDDVELCVNIWHLGPTGTNYFTHWAARVYGLSGSHDEKLATLEYLAKSDFTTVQWHELKGTFWSEDEDRVVERATKEIAGAVWHRLSIFSELQALLPSEYVVQNRHGRECLFFDDECGLCVETFLAQATDGRIYPQPDSEPDVSEGSGEPSSKDSSATSRKLLTEPDKASPEQLARLRRQGRILSPEEAEDLVRRSKPPAMRQGNDIESITRAQASALIADPGYVERIRDRKAAPSTEGSDTANQAAPSDGTRQGEPGATGTAHRQGRILSPEEGASLVEQSKPPTRGATPLHEPAAGGEPLQSPDTGEP